MNRSALTSKVTALFVTAYVDSEFLQTTLKDVMILMNVQNLHITVHTFAPISMELMPVLAVKALKTGSMEFAG